MDRRIRLLTVDENDATPLYMQLARKLTSAIEAGQWIAGEALPSERTLVDALGISRVTARRALQVLDEEGTILRNRGAGTFIAPRFSHSLTRLDNFSEMVRPRGFVPKSEVIDFQRREPTSEEANVLGLDAGDEVAALSRLRKADATIVSFDQSTLPAGILADAGAMGESLYAYLDRIGEPVVRAVQHIRAVVATAQLAQLLAIPVGEPLMLVSRTGFSQAGVPIEFTRSHCVNDYYDFVVELKR